MNKTFNVATGVLLASILSGCVVYETSYRRPPPPPDRGEVIVVAPFPDAIWVPGVWVWQRRHREYHWRDGYWKRRGHHYRHRRD